MSFYDSMADGLSKHAGVFVVVVLLVTGMMFVVFGTMEQSYEASSDPAGSTFIGFLIIGFSPMTIFSKFGFLTALMIAMAFIAAVVVLPAFLALTVRKPPEATEPEAAPSTSEG